MWTWGLASSYAAFQKYCSLAASSGATPRPRVHATTIPVFAVTTPHPPHCFDAARFQTCH